MMQWSPWSSLSAS